MLIRKKSESESTFQIEEEEEDDEIENRGSYNLCIYILSNYLGNV